MQNSSSESCHSSRVHCILHKCVLSCFPVGLQKRREAEWKSSHPLCLSDPRHPLQLCSGSLNLADGNITPFCLLFVSEPPGSAWPTVQITHLVEKLWRRGRSGNRDNQARHTQISCKTISSKLMSSSSQPFPLLLWRTCHYLLTRTTFLKCPILFRLISYSPALNCSNLSKKIIQMAQLLTDIIFHLVFKWTGLRRHHCITTRWQLQLKHLSDFKLDFFYLYTEDLHPPAVSYSTELGGFMCYPPSEVYLIQTTA